MDKIDDIRGEEALDRDELLTTEMNEVAEELAEKAHDMDASVDMPLDERSNKAEPFGMLMAKRLKRRSFMKGSAAVAAGTAAVAAPTIMMATDAEAGSKKDSLTFDPIEGSSEDTVIVPEGYEWYSILQWGQSLSPFVPDMTDEDLLSGEHLTKVGAKNQGDQFGYNCDAVEFFSMPTPDSNGKKNGLICVNHEYINSNLVYPGLFDTNDAGERLYPTMASYFEAFPNADQWARNTIGITVAEIEKKKGQWKLVQSSGFNRRITMDTNFALVGPARGNDFLKTTANTTGRRSKGTYNNCAAGGTPWGTYLSAEENTDGVFSNYSGLEAAIGESEDPADIKLLDMHRRLEPRETSFLGFEVFDDRFDVAKEPNEPFRFGWVCEVDPYDPASTPRKLTALGRFKHECATTIKAEDERCVVYMGDDARFEYVYKFVSAKKIKADRRRNRNLLNTGTLYVAKFNDDGTGEWMALDYDSQEVLQTATVEGTDIPQFDNQGEVLINARRAGDLLGATPMDRPEDVEANPVTRKVYIACTNNTRRKTENTIGDRQGRDVQEFPDIPNPRPVNSWGHIVEITEDNNDNTAETFTWDMFMLCGDPQSAAGRYLTQEEDLNDVDLETEQSLNRDDTYYAGFPYADLVAPIGAPDNISFDNKGNLWIVTDGGQPLGTNNGTFAVPTFGPNRGYLRQFMSGPIDSETCGAEFTPDNKTIFLNIQHPGDGGILGDATSDFPNGNGSEPRPSLIGVRNLRNKPVGK